MPGGRPRVVETSFLASFLGGLLSLLSPCSALLLPAFFAYAFQSRGVLVGRTAVFYLGLCATLVPLGMGISAVSSLVYGHRSTLITVSGLIIITFGVIQALGGGFAFGPIERLRGGISGSSLLATFCLGAVYGFAGFCSRPILGAVLTVAATSGSALRGAGLLATYAAGMAAPLFLMALLWDRLDLGHRRWLRGRWISPLAHDQPPLWPDVRRDRGPVYHFRGHLQPRRPLRLGRSDGPRLVSRAVGAELRSRLTSFRGVRGSRLAVCRTPRLQARATPQEEACGARGLDRADGASLAWQVRRLGDRLRLREDRLQPGRRRLTAGDRLDHTVDPPRRGHAPRHVPSWLQRRCQGRRGDGLSRARPLLGRRRDRRGQGHLRFLYHPAADEKESGRGIRERYDEAAALVLGAFSRLGVMAQVGEVRDEFCPGDHSIRVGDGEGGMKIVGIAQRITRRATSVGGIVLVEGERELARVLERVYSAMQLPFRPQSVGSLRRAGYEAGHRT